MRCDRATGTIGTSQVAIAPSSLDLPSLSIEIQEITESVVKHYYKLVRNNLNVPENIRGEKRENINSTELVLAFGLQEDGTADTRLEQKIFAFLPTRAYLALEIYKLFER